MSVKFGMIGEKEIDLAKKTLAFSYRFGNGQFVKKNLWFEKPHTGNYIRGYAYDDVEELTDGAKKLFIKVKRL